MRVGRVLGLGRSCPTCQFLSSSVTSSSRSDVALEGRPDGDWGPPSPF